MYNHAISAKKFRIIEAILELGWNVLLSDIDVLVVKASPVHLCQLTKDMSFHSSTSPLQSPGELFRACPMHAVVIAPCQGKL